MHDQIDVPVSLIAFAEAHSKHNPPGTFNSSLTTAESIMASSGLAYLPLKFSFEIPYMAMLEEAQALRHRFIPHRTREYNRGWHCLMFHGLSSTLTLNHNAYGIPEHQARYDWTDLAPLMPETIRFFRDVFGYSVYERVRVLLLEPGGYILPHVDMTEDRLGPINIALNNPDGCEFIMAGVGVIPFKPGHANMLSLVRRHIVWNRSNEPRYHIIVNGERDLTAHWKDTIPHSYVSYFDTVCQQVTKV